MSKVLSILLLASIFTFAGCNPSIVEQQQMDKMASEGYPDIVKEVIEIQGCEYMRIVGRRTETLVHKGNCKNKIHYVK